mgnify:CR=1 FL=1
MKTVKPQDHFLIKHKILDFDLKEMCFGEHEELNLTEYTQPCMVSVCLAIVQELKKRGINPDITAGLSLESMQQLQQQAA